MPFWIIAAITCIVITARYVRTRTTASLDNGERIIARRDAMVGVVLAAGWLGLWLLYLTYTWTVTQGVVGRGPGGGGVSPGAGIDHFSY